MTSIFAIMCCLATAGGHQNCQLSGTQMHRDEAACVEQRDRQHIDGETCRCVEYHSTEVVRTCKPQGLLLPFGSAPSNSTGLSGSLSPH